MLRDSYIFCHDAIKLIIATGGPGMVKAAYSAGKPAIGVGAGNSPSYIERVDVGFVEGMIPMIKPTGSATSNILFTGSKYSEDQIDKILQNMVRAAEEHAAELAQMAVEETGFGKVQDKIYKNHGASTLVYNYIKDMKTDPVFLPRPLPALP